MPASPSAALAARDDRLLRVLPDAVASPLKTRITLHDDLRASRRCRVVFDPLTACLRGHAGKTPAMPDHADEVTPDA